jgi:hypothetical protein
MTQAEQDMYDTMLIAQKTLKADEMKVLKDKMGYDGMGMTKAVYDALSADKQKAAKQRLNMMKDKFIGRKDIEQKDDNDVRTGAGVKKMTTE